MSKIRMDYLSRMAIFARVAELGSFTNAAKELGLTSSSVSQHIRALEVFLGTTLLHRTTRKLSLTEAGDLFYINCAKVVDAARDAQQKIAALNDEPVGELRVAVSSFMSSRYLVPALEDFIHNHPKIKLSLDVSDRHIDLIEHRIDLALRVGRISTERDIPLAWFEDILCAAPAYLERHNPIHNPDDLVNHDFLLFTPHGEPSYFDLTNQRGEVVRIRTQPRVSANHARSLRRLAVQGHGVARLLFAKVKDDIDEGRLKIVLPDWRLAGFDAYITIRHREDIPPKVKFCVEHIQAFFKTLSCISLNGRD